MSELPLRARLLRAALHRDGPVEPVEEVFGQWLELARTERVIPLLFQIVTSAHPNPAPFPWSSAYAAQLEAMGVLVRFEHDLLEVAHLLSSQEIEFAVLKGAATAHLDYTDPSMRQFGDVDLLVNPYDLQRACTVLARAGWKRAYPLPKGHEVFTHAITLRSGNRVELDLHQKIAHRAVGELVVTSELMARRVQYEIAGQALWALGDHDRLIHAALHAVTASGRYRRLSSTADVLVLAEASATTASEVVACADGWQIGSLFRRAIEAAYTDAMLPLPEAWALAGTARPASRDRLVDAAYREDRRRPALEELAYLRVMQGWRHRGNYLRGYFVASGAYAERNRRHGFIDQAKYLWSRLRNDDR